jgi:hypothetical protein
MPTRRGLRLALAIAIAVASAALLAPGALSVVPYLRGPAFVVPGKSATFLFANVAAQDLNWVRVQARPCPSRFGCTASYVRISSKRMTSAGLQLTFRWPAGYVVCTSEPQGSGGFCSAAGHTWRNNESASVFIGSFVFDIGGCASVHVHQAPSTPSEPNPPNGESYEEIPLPCR